MSLKAVAMTTKTVYVAIDSYSVHKPFNQTSKKKKGCANKKRRRRKKRSLRKKRKIKMVYVMSLLHRQLQLLSLAFLVLRFSL
jgi:hypothetical protein